VSKSTFFEGRGLLWANTLVDREACIALQPLLVSEN